MAARENMAVRKLSSPEIAAVRPRDEAPLEEGIARKDREACATAADPGSTMALYRIPRMKNENFSSLGEYLAHIMAEFERPRSCRIYLRRGKDEASPDIEHRISVYWGKRSFMVDESSDPALDQAVRARILSSLASGQPVLFNSGNGTKMVFDSLMLDDQRFSVSQLTDEERELTSRSLGIMLSHYRDPANPSCIALFEGDLRCRGSRATGTDADFWSSAAMMQAAFEINFMLVHKFDAITILTRVQDFKADFRMGVRQLISNQLQNMYMIMLDIDDFKGVNTAFGWNGGNVVLRMVAETIKKSVRVEDPVSRLGGEEFGIILRNMASREEAMVIAERVRKSVESLRISIGARTANVTCSIGVTRIDEIANRMIVYGDYALDYGLLDSIYDASLVYAGDGVAKAKSGGKNAVSYQTAPSLL